MSNGAEQRKLTGIMFIDMVGYSTLGVAILAGARLPSANAALDLAPV